MIADTMVLCRDMGELYLWVDRLCIVQDDAESKHTQICGIDNIYRSAVFTAIAALKGLGLLGCFGRPRKSLIWCPPRDCKHEVRVSRAAMGHVCRGLAHPHSEVRIGAIQQPLFLVPFTKMTLDSLKTCEATRGDSKSHL